MSPEAEEWGWIYESRFSDDTDFFDLPDPYEPTNWDYRRTTVGYPGEAQSEAQAGGDENPYRKS